MPTVDPPCRVDFATSDIPGARAFYGALLGWTFTDQGPETGHYHTAAYDGRQAAGIGSLAQKGGPVPHWTNYPGTDDIDAALEEVTAFGGQTFCPPMDIGAHGRMALIADPGGAVVGLWQAKGHAGVGHRDAPGGFAWTEVNTRDSRGTTAFFEQLTGLAPKAIEGMQYHAFHSEDGKAHFGVLQMTEEWGDMPPHWMPYFAVTSADETATRVPEVGGTVHYGPFDSPYGRILVCADPAGAAVTFIELADHY